MVFGIDYGSKLAGTTAIAFIHKEALCIEQSIKKQDADLFIQQTCIKYKPSLLAIDAPLSLPKVYTQGDSDNYFYRTCDQALKAMSPMFIGGLTARAIKLKDSLGIPSIEVYPKAVQQQLLPTLVNYKKEKPSPTQIQLLEEILKCPINCISNWHQFDACLALVSGLRYQAQEAVSIGDQEEGLIWV